MCQFSIPFTTTATDLFEKAKTAISQAGGTLTGDASGGNFYISSPFGNITGDFTIQNQEITITITHKPFLISCDKIEAELRKYLSNSFE